ncbi:MAG: VOC family protein, partial [Frankiales bacterium]|nr:VOC family protein [Frankiales bacterium]
MSRVTPFLWYDGDAEQAAELYTSLFPNSAISEVTRYGEGSPGEPGTAMTVAFTLDGVPFTALN